MADKRHRPTAAEREAILAFVRKLCDGRRHTGDIKRLTAEKFGVQPRTVENYITEVRQERIAESGRSVEDHRSDAFYFYVSVLRNKNAEIRDRLKAQERLDKLLGLEKPQKVESSNLDISITPEQLAAMTDEELDALWRRLAVGGGRP